MQKRNWDRLGAPGDGNTTLTAKMQEFLTQRGLVPQNTAEGADYAVEGHVNMAEAPNNQERVEVLWTVTRRDGYELGRVLQMNEVPRGMLNRYWGDVAFVVANEASAGVRDVLSNAGAPPGPQTAPEPPPRTGGNAPLMAPSLAPDGQPALPLPTANRR